MANSPKKNAVNWSFIWKAEGEPAAWQPVNCPIAAPGIAPPVAPKSEVRWIGTLDMMDGI